MKRKMMWFWAIVMVVVTGAAGTSVLRCGQRLGSPVRLQGSQRGLGVNHRAHESREHQDCGLRFATTAQHRGQTSDPRAQEGQGGFGPAGVRLH